MRSIYTFLGVLGDIGGLKEALSQIASLILFLKFLLFGNPMHEYMLEKLFFRNPKQILDDGEPKLKSNEDKVAYLKQRTPFKFTKTFFMCMRSEKEKRMIDTGVSRIEQRLEIGKFMKMQMKMTIALKHMFTQAERFLIRNNRKFVLKSDADSNSSDENVYLSESAV